LIRLLGDEENGGPPVIPKLICLFENTIHRRETSTLRAKSSFETSSFTDLSQKDEDRNGVLTVFQTDGSRFRRAKAALKEKMKKIMHRKLEDLVRL
jgi:hypothetical protein